jgi:hypothetical protein
MKRKSGPTGSSNRVRQTTHARRGINIRIIFDADVAPLVEERVWFEAQRITPLGDGRIELCGTTTSLTGVDLWVFGWGPSAQVLEPSRLRRRIRDIAQSIVERG